MTTMDLGTFYDQYLHFGFEMSIRNVKVSFNV